VASVEAANAAHGKASNKVLMSTFFKCMVVIDHRSEFFDIFERGA
jgi:hypothetical protein